MHLTGLKNGIVAIALCVLTAPLSAEIIGAVRVPNSLSGGHNSVVVERFSDPAISGVNCYISRAEPSKIMPELINRQVLSDLKCVKTQKLDVPIAIASGKRDGEEIYKKTFRNKILKQAFRFYDQQQDALVYLVIDFQGEGQVSNNLSVVAVRN